MNSTVKTLLGFLFGAGIGSGVTYYILKKKFQKDYDIKFTEEFEKFKHDYKLERYEDFLEKKEEEAKENQKKLEDEIAKHGPDPRETENTVVDTHKVDYTKIQKEEEDEDMKDFDVNFIDKPENVADKPYIVSEEEHYSGPKWYDFEEYKYIIPSEDVLDDDDNIIDDVSKILGWDNLEKLAQKSDGDYIYIRNEYYECDYLVTLLDWRDKI